MYKVKEFIMRVRRKCKNLSYRIRIKDKDFTLIAQNCIGGVIYSQLGIEFKSPTINMFIEDENFVKLVDNLPYYLSTKPYPIEDSYIDPIDSSICYPKIGVGDIELCCLHYKDCKSAIAAWERRCKRINLKKVYVIGNSWNMHNDRELIKHIADCKYPVHIFTTDDMKYKNCQQLPGEKWIIDKRGIVRPNITDTVPGSYLKYYETFFDFVSWLNGDKK
ncbi:DUF1919 domain-containing protein [Ruminococcus flavefaciens]|uniref:DUF1919 domain-containing protein n=1 Tax=Ruminococcus flavefaciens TaxID=1265 RepID=UPI00048A6FFD|nr:DUF1919 domain-containing protein [Ruminococcus flavefaciens]